MQLPLRHLSVRVPWHYMGWNGQLCRDSRSNSSCMFLPRIQNKDVDFEEKNNCAWIHELAPENYPPCLDEKVTFDELQWRVEKTRYELVLDPDINVVLRIYKSPGQ